MSLQRESNVEHPPNHISRPPTLPFLVCREAFVLPAKMTPLPPSALWLPKPSPFDLLEFRKGNAVQRAQSMSLRPSTRKIRPPHHGALVHSRLTPDGSSTPDYFRFISFL
uniref:Uncharacterized protein n=1 Tax=Bionectria ochroleuca TaxID=29856 RepID=A0A8H7TUP0_BIOOC